MKQSYISLVSYRRASSCLLHVALMSLLLDETTSLFSESGVWCSNSINSCKSRCSYDLQQPREQN